MTATEPRLKDDEAPPVPTYRYFNRELSWLDFNDRVLQLAQDPSTPLLERLKFCAIYANNLDEFFMVRVAGLLDHLNEGSVPSDGDPAGQTIALIAEHVRELGASLEQALYEEILPSLASEGIRLLSLEECTPEEREQISEWFRERIFPVLTPLAVGPGRPFPYISNLSLSLGVMVRDPQTSERRFARVKVPEVLPRFLAVERGRRYVALEDVIADNIGALFPGMQVDGQATFRVTRDADFEISDDQDDLLRAVEKELSERRFGQVVRLEIDERMSEPMRSLLVRALGVEPENVYPIRGILDLADLMPLASIDRPELRYTPWTPRTIERLVPDDEDEVVDVFAAIRDGDLLVHHPYDSFDTSVERFIEQAVDDPNVLAIKHTIYRTSGDSPIVPALARAAERAKQAVAVVEVKARFDEEKNIRWARTLERAGVHVVHGMVGLKTHCKLALVVRREGDETRRYVHIGTGNYHPATARIYTDLGLFTCDEEITADVSDLFNQLTGFARPRRYRKLLVAPLGVRERILAEIRRAIDEHTEEAPARIAMKMNAIVDRPIIDALYEASRAGVRVDLVIRGICSLRPGVPGLSENIHVISILGRFLEHSRIFRFETAVNATTFFGSADLMPRNLDSRIEAITPIEDELLQRQVVDILDLQLADTSGSWRLDADGVWTRIRPVGDEEPISSQDLLMAAALSGTTAERNIARREEVADRIVKREKPREATP